MQFLLLNTPDGVNQRVPVNIIKIHPDGRFDAQSTDGMITILGIRPTGVRLENEDGSAATPTVYDPLDGLQQRLQEAEATIADLQRQLSLSQPIP